MSATEQTLPPPVTWAQRKQVVFLTFCVEDCKNLTLKIEPQKIYFKGTGGTEQKNYESTIELYKDIDTEKSRQHKSDRNIELILIKKEDGPYWPHLTQQKVKHHWLKVDFSKWRDEDDSDDEMGRNGELEDMMRQMGGLGGDDRPSLDDLEDDNDSDDEELPDLE